MKHTASAAIILVASALCAPAVAWAQGPVTSFDQLNTRLKVGDTVWVTDAQGREVRGKILELHDASITLDGDPETTLQGDSVRLVQRSSKSIRRAALWGLVIGAAVGAGLGIADSNGCSSDCMSNVPLMSAALVGGIGAGVGAAVRAALPPGRKEVYRAPGPTPARLSIAPVITPRAKGVAVSFAF